MGGRRQAAAPLVRGACCRGLRKRWAPLAFAAALATAASRGVLKDPTFLRFSPLSESHAGHGFFFDLQGRTPVYRLTCKLSN